MQENICLTMEIPKIATTALLARSVRTVRLRAPFVEMGSTQMQQPKLPFVFLVAQESTVIKTFKPRWIRAKIVQRAGIPLPQAYQVLVVVTIVLRANIQQKKATLNRPNV
jgi:hypothetical protein